MIPSSRTERTELYPHNILTSGSFHKQDGCIFLTLPLTYNAVGHKVMPVEFATAVVPLVKIFHFRDQIFQFHGQ